MLNLIFEPVFVSSTIGWNRLVISVSDAEFCLCRVYFYTELCNYLYLLQKEIMHFTKQLSHAGQSGNL